MFNITEIGFSGRRNIIATAASFIEAKNKVEAMAPLYMEDDSDYPGCADAYLTGGRVVAIQPEGFTL